MAQSAVQTRKMQLLNYTQRKKLLNCLRIALVVAITILYVSPLYISFNYSFKTPEELGASSQMALPGMDGLTMGETLARELPNARIIFISAYDEFAYAQKAVRLHAHEYLLKPLENEKLIDSDRRAVEELREQDSGAQVEHASAKDSLVSSILQYVNARPHHPTLQETAAHFGFSPSYISSIVKKETGKNYIELVTRSRMELAKKLLRDPSYRIEEVAAAVGYKNYISFYQLFVKYEGVSPRDGEEKTLHPHVGAVCVCPAY